MTSFFKNISTSKQHVGLCFIAFCSFLFFNACNSVEPKVNQQSVYEIKADSLLQLMTLEEKVGQMTNISLMAIAEGEFWMRRDTVILDTAKMKTLLAKHHVGSVQNLGTYPFSTVEWRSKIRQIQNFINNNTRLKIPVLYAIDAVHGANYTAGSTLFPQQINLAAGFNTEITEKVAAATAYELKASGIPLNYSPVLDVAQNQTWGRIFETFGEDTYVTTKHTEAYIKGHQGSDFSAIDKAAVCLKHFIGYGNAVTGKDRTPILLPENKIREIHLPPFNAAIKLGAKVIMLNSGSVNGIPSHADTYMITDLLKKELNFSGFVISDWEDVVNLEKVHQIAKTEKEAVKIAVNAGLDMCMDPYDASFAELLIELVNENQVSINRINDAVKRILTVKFELGLFNTLMESEVNFTDFAGKNHQETSYQAAVESITLLKNTNNILPISKSDKILITGYSANSINVLNGAWSRTWSGEDTSFNDTEKATILTAFQTRLTVEPYFTQGTSYDRLINIEKTLNLAKKVDKIIICLGELPATEKPSDIDELAYPTAQLQLVKNLSKLGKPIVLVLVQARPRLINDIEPYCSAIVNAYLPGNEGGDAIADIILGNENPSGKLPYTYPKYSNSLLTYTHTKADTRDKAFGFEGFNPQFEFGFGLSYTKFNYKNLSLNKDTFLMDEPILVSVQIENIGQRVGKESVLFYTSDLVASEVPAIKKLRYFEKVLVEPSSTKTINFSLSKNDLAFINKQNKSITEEGDFTITVGNLTKQFYLKN